MKYLILLHSMYRSPLPTLPTGRQAAGLMGLEFDFSLITTNRSSLCDYRKAASLRTICRIGDYISTRSSIAATY